MTGDRETRVFCTFTFEALHRWPGAQGAVAFLAFPHRHLFHVRVEKRVRGVDREVEFIGWRRGLESYARHLAQYAETWSCEQWAHALMSACDACRVEVSEDGENGAVVEEC